MMKAWLPTVLHRPQTNEGEDSSDSENLKETSENSDRDRIWLELLAERPDNREGKEMVQWLEKVVSVSESPPDRYKRRP
jgi:hypothetical protein